MKKPEKIEPRCPLIQSPCVEEGCCWWVKMERRNIATGAVEPYGVCATVGQIGVLCENSQAINRMNETITVNRNETVDVIRNHSLAMAMHLDRATKAVEGNRK